MKISHKSVYLSLFQKEWKDAKRKLLPLSFGIVIFSLFTVLMMFVLPSLIPDFPAELFPELTPSVLSQTFFSNANNILAIIAVILCVDSIAGEREKNTLTFLKTSPISNYSIIFIKTLTRFLLIIIPSLISIGIIYFLIWLLSGIPPTSSYLLSTVFFILLLFLYISVGIFVSSFTKTQISSGILSVVFVFGFTLISSFLNQGNAIKYNFLQLPINTFIDDFPETFSALNLLLNSLLILGLSSAFLILSLVIFSSEKEPTRK